MADFYRENIVNKGNKGSDLLEQVIELSRTNSGHVEEWNGQSIITGVPKDHLVLVYSFSGRAHKDVEEHTRSLVNNLAGIAYRLGATPIGFTNVIDTPDGDLETLAKIGNSLLDSAQQHDVSVLNGENTLMGDRVTTEANISGTMVSIVPKGRYIIPESGIVGEHAFFDPQGQAAYANCDGVGSKVEFYERTGDFDRGIIDLAAMTLDDAVKQGGKAEVFSIIAETRKKIPLSVVRVSLQDLSRKLGIRTTLQQEKVGKRIQGYEKAQANYHLNGTVVSTISQERLVNPLRSARGEYLIAIKGKANQRSNGITSKRKAMVKHFGEDWHLDKKCAHLTDYLARPSTVLYPYIRKLLDQGLITNFYHLSGGSFDGKLAKPLAKEGLFADLHSNFLYEPCKEEQELVELAGLSIDDAYAQWNMGIDGFVTATSKNQLNVISFLKSMGLQSEGISKLEGTGVRLTSYKGGEVYFSGR